MTYNERLRIYGEDKRDRAIKRTQHLTRKFAPDSPAYKHVAIDGKEQDLIVKSTEVNSTKTIIAMPGDDFPVGGIVLWNSSHWMITQRDIESDVLVRGTMEQCNRQIKWQNTDTLEIVSRWCVVDNPYSNSLETTATLSESHRKFKIMLPYDEETLLLDLDKRFMLESVPKIPKVYKLVSVDSLTERYDYKGESRGFLVLNVEQDVYNPETDNRVLEICDYLVSHESVGEDENLELKIEFIGLPEVKSGGMPKTFTARVYNTDTGEEVTQDEVEISMTGAIAPEMEDYISVEIVGNEATISAKANSMNIGAQVELNASIKTRSLSCDLTVTVVSLV